MNDHWFELRYRYTVSGREVEDTLKAGTIGRLERTWGRIKEEHPSAELIGYYSVGEHKVETSDDEGYNTIV